MMHLFYSFSINAVQEENRYFWRYQRYQLISECFEKPIFAYPPLSLITYIWVIVKLIRRRRTKIRVLSMLLFYSHNKI